MPTDRELMQQALDLLRGCRVFVVSREKLKHPEGTDVYEEVIEALRTRLAQPEQDGECQRCNGRGCTACDARFLSSEPVAWMLTGGSDIYLASDFEPDAESLFNWTPLFTAPPQREWQGLTDEERETAIDAVPAANLGGEYYDKELTAIALAIEAKIKEKNHG